jgi:hypothetical protein
VCETLRFSANITLTPFSATLKLLPKTRRALRPDAAEIHSFADKTGAEKAQEQLNRADELETDSAFYSVFFSYLHAK